MNRFEINRRGLLVAAGSLPFASSAFASDGTIRKANWAIVGLGGFAVNQIMPNFAFSKHSKMTAFVSGTPEKLKTYGEKYGVTSYYDYKNFDDIKNNHDIDCVYIILPVGMHAEYTIRALKAGKHVLCEKPMASTAAECEAMIAAAKAANKQLGVAYRVHFEPNNIAALKATKAGEIGIIRQTSGDAGFVANPDYLPHKWRLTKSLGGGGSMYDIGIYALNGALMHIDEAPIAVSAVYNTPPNDPRFKEVEGGLAWRLHFASALNAQGSSSYDYSYLSRQRFFGTKGGLNLEPASNYDQVKPILYRDGQAPLAINAGDPLTQFAAQLDGFSLAALSNTKHRTPGEMGLRDMKLIEAMYKSADNGGAVVKL